MKILDTAKAAVVTAGRIQKKHFGQSLFVDHKKKNDIKLEVDRLSEEAILNTIRQTHPEHSFIAEESGTRDMNSEYVWIIDPLDGTVNFFYGLPYFCSSVACYKNVRTDGLCSSIEDLGEPVAAAVYAVMTDELFAAENGKGATLNDQPIKATEITELSEAMIATGFGSTIDGLEKMFNGTQNLSNEVRKMRCLGAAAYDICNSAAGRLSGFFEKGLHVWDIAAGALIAKEAGAIFDAVEYEKGLWNVVSCGQGIHDLLVNSLEGEKNG